MIGSGDLDRVNCGPATAEAEGLEPPRACARRISSALPGRPEPDASSPERPAAQGRGGRDHPVGTASARLRTLPLTPILTPVIRAAAALLCGVITRSGALEVTE